MSLQVVDRSEIPEDTAKLGQELLAEDNIYRQLGDKLSDLLKDEDFAWLYSPIGGPALSPVILALVTVFQMMEKQPDRLGAEMVRVRIDWKYALHLPLSWAGFHWTNLSHFRQRLIENEAEYLVFDRLVRRLVELGFIRRRGKQRTDSMSILGLVAKLSRLELVLEAMRVVLQGIEKVDAAWLAKNVPVAFLERYQNKKQTYKMTEEEVAAELRQTGADGLWLWQQLEAAPPEIQELEPVKVMGEIWAQQFEWDEAGSYQGPRAKLAGHGLIQSPHEPEVRYREKRDKQWQGYVGQASETAEDKGEVNFITDIGVTDAQESDVRSLPEAQERLVEREVPPGEQDVDQAYVSGTSLAESEARGIKLVGPIGPETGPKEFKLSDFQVELAAKKATCPAGQTAERWSEQRRADGTVEYRFHFGEQCGGCPLRPDCTEAQAGRTITYHEHHQQVEQCRAEMETEEFKAAMKRRAPIEGTISQLARAGGRYARYRGLRKVNLQLVFTAVGVNLRRLCAAWGRGHKPSWVAVGAN
jgi:transposase